VLTFTCFVGGLASSCTISDADRCASGYVYISDTKVCSLIPDAAVGGTPDLAPSDNQDGAVASGTPDLSAATVSEAGGGGPTFGTTCSTSADCQSATTNFCMIQPGAPSGYCSKAQCTTECPSDYKCCNCAAVSLVACFKSADATAATAAIGCICS